MPRPKKPTAREKIAQAIENLDDGNYTAAVNRLREAAEIIEEAAKDFSGRLEKSIGAKPEVKP